MGDILNYFIDGQTAIRLYLISVPGNQALTLPSLCHNRDTGQKAAG